MPCKAKATDFIVYMVSFDAIYHRGVDKRQPQTARVTNTAEFL